MASLGLALKLVLLRKFQEVIESGMAAKVAHLAKMRRRKCGLYLHVNHCGKQKFLMIGAVVMTDEHGGASR
jgi:hypothetical protein